MNIANKKFVHLIYLCVLAFIVIIILAIFKNRLTRKNVAPNFNSNVPKKIINTLLPESDAIDVLCFTRDAKCASGYAEAYYNSENFEFAYLWGYVARRLGCEDENNDIILFKSKQELYANEQQPIDIEALAHHYNFIQNFTKSDKAKSFFWTQQLYDNQNGKVGMTIVEDQLISAIASYYPGDNSVVVIEIKGLLGIDQ